MRPPILKVAMLTPANHLRRPLTLLLVSLFCILALHINASLAAGDLLPQGIARAPSDDLNQIGYRHGWIERVGEMAKEAIQADEPYLAQRLWTAMAQEGVAEGAYHLAMLYDSGNGIAHDSVRAAYWYRRAAEAGHLHAQHNLAVAYANGDGVEMDFNKALAWWTLAASSGNADSQYNLGIVYATGVHGVAKNLKMAKKWWRMAAMKGDPMAQYNLGTIYASEGQVSSYCEAMHWWQKSAEKGIQQANWALEMIKARHDYRACR